MTSLEQELLQMLKEERARQDILIQMLYECRRDPNRTETETIVQIPDSQRVAGKLPWKKQQEMLEKRYAKDKSIQDEDRQSSENADPDKNESSNSGEHSGETPAGQAKYALFQKEKEVC